MYRPVLLNVGKLRLSERQKKILVALKRIDEIEAQAPERYQENHIYRYRRNGYLQRRFDKPVIRTWKNKDGTEQRLERYNEGSFSRSTMKLRERGLIKGNPHRKPIIYRLTPEGLEIATRLENEARAFIEEWRSILNFGAKLITSKGDSDS
jgi:hypothetical protein